MLFKGKVMSSLVRRDLHEHYSVRIDKADAGTKFERNYLFKF